MNPRTQFISVVTALIVVMGLLTFSHEFNMRANAAVWPYQPDVSSGVFTANADGTIGGIVYNADHSAIIPYAGVGVAKGTGNGWSWTSYCAGADGHFSISLEYGSYKVFAYGESRCSTGQMVRREFWREKTSYETADTVTLSPGSPVVAGIDFTLDPGGSISGHIYEQDGVTPVTNAQITVNILDQNDSVAHANTDAQGYYIVNGLEARTDYKVQASADGYLRAFYPHQARWENAGVVSVAIGQTTSDTNIRLLKANAYITGRVTYSDGTPTANVWVEAFHTDGWFVGISANANGEYRSPVIGGTWEVFPYQPPYQATSKQVTLTTGQTIGGIDFILQAAGAISGHVFKTDGVSVIADATISVHAHGVSTGASSRGAWVSQADGSYTISSLAPGTYKVQGNNNRVGGYISEYYNSKASWDQADTVTVVAGQTTNGIDFALESGGAVSGHVYEQDGVTPIAGAHLAARGAGGDWNYFADTGSDGSYVMLGMPSNTYEIKVEALGYAIQWYHDKPAPSNFDWVPVVAPNTTTGIDFKLRPGGAVAGRVFKADGITPINDAAIQVCAEPTAPNLVGNCSWISQPSGSYTIPGLTANVAYKVRANHNLAPGYVTKYYNNKYSWDTADTVMITAKQTTEGIDFALEAGGAISGRVYEQDGVTPVANACVNVSTTAPQWNQVAGFCCTGSDGSFTINGLAPGQVYLRTHADCQRAHPDLQDEWYAQGGSTPDGSQASPVSVVAGQTTPGINFQLNRTTVVKGIIYNADGTQPIPRAGINYSPADNQGGYSTYCADENGRFTIPMSPGSYKFFARGDKGCGSDPNLAREYWHETAEWDQAEVIAVSAAMPTVHEISFTLSPGGSIWGTVRDATSLSPIGGGLVVAYSPDGQLAAFVCAYDDGSYVIPGFLLGDYKVWAGGWCRANPNYVREYWQEKLTWETADIVTLSEGSRERREVNFTLLLGSRIAGMIYRSDGVTPITGTSVFVRLYNAATGAIQAETQTWQGDGSFAFSAFPSGTYRVKAWVPSDTAYFEEYYNDKPDQAAADILTLAADQTMSGINFSLDRGAIVEIPPPTGATLVYTDTQTMTTTVQIPALAVAKTTTLKYTEVMKASAPSGFAFAEHAFDLTAYQEGQPVSGLTFAPPAIVTINYSDADVARVDESTLQLSYWNGSAWSTDGITLIERDLVGNRLVATISHLSKFATFGEPKKLLYLPLITRRNP